MNLMNSAYPRTGKRGAPQVFARKLYQILEEENTDSACWNELGNAFFVKDVEEFSEKILMKYFRHCKYQSFQRQLNLYGFRKVTRGPYAGAHAHQYFLKGRADLLVLVRRYRPSSPTPSQASPESFSPQIEEQVQAEAAARGYRKVDFEGQQRKETAVQGLPPFTPFDRMKCSAPLHEAFLRQRQQQDQLMQLHRRLMSSSNPFEQMDEMTLRQLQLHLAGDQVIRDVYSLTSDPCIKIDNPAELMNMPLLDLGLPPAAEAACQSQGVFPAKSDGAAETITLKQEEDEQLLRSAMSLEELLVAAPPPSPQGAGNPNGGLGGLIVSGGDEDWSELTDLLSKGSGTQQDLRVLGGGWGGGNLLGR